MTYLDAALTVLRAAGEPLHYEEITQRALDQKLISPQGLTPAATMGSRLYTDTKQEGSAFVRAGHGRFGLVEWEPKGIDARVKEINQTTRLQLRGLVEAIEPARFEALIRELLIQMGFDENTVEMTPYHKDQGIDVTGTYRAAGLTDVSAAVQVKHWKTNVGAPTVTQLRGSLQVHQQGIIITTSSFSKAAQAEASAPSKTRIGLINGEELIDLLIKHRVGVVERELKVTALDEEYWGELVGEAGLDAKANGDIPSKVSKVRAVSDDHQKANSAKPEGFVLFGQQYGADSWRAVLLGVCEALAQHHGDAFGPAAMTVKGKTRQYVAESPEGMITPTQIPGTDLWVEANQSAKSVQQVIVKLLDALGDQAEDFAVVL